MAYVMHDCTRRLNVAVLVSTQFIGAVVIKLPAFSAAELHDTGTGQLADQDSESELCVNPCGICDPRMLELGVREADCVAWAKDVMITPAAVVIMTSRSPAWHPMLGYGL